MSATLKKIDPSEVELGMFVAQLGGSWFDHNFWQSNFLIEEPDDLERIFRSSVPYVVIDESRGKSAAEPAGASAADPAETRGQTAGAKSNGAAKRALYRSADPNDPQTQARRRATAVTNKSKQAVKQIFSDLQFGCVIDKSSVNEVLDDIVTAVEEDARTLLSVTSIKTKDDYTYLHSVAVCALMICVAKHRGLSKDETRELGLAGLLHDVGKISIPDPILNKPGRLTDEEFETVRNHPVKGHEFLSESPGMTETALDVCLHHHEKIDGTGYPVGLSHDEISSAARLGAVCDVFDALTSQRVYKEPWSPQKALTRMWSWEGHFDRAAMTDLMDVLHVYAEALLVRLSDDRLALTMATLPLSKSVPVVAFYSIEKGERIAPEPIQIAKDDPDFSIVGIEDPDQWDFANWDDLRAEVLEKIAS